MLNRVVIAATLALAVAASAAAQSTSGTQTSGSQTSGTQTSGSQTSGTRTPGTTATTTSQTTQTTSPSSSTQSEDMQTRPATTTFMGDTGLWYVPTGEVLPKKKWSISAYRVNFDDNQGFSDISNWPLTFAFGATDRLEVFGSWVLVNRVDRDIRPLFVSSIPQAGASCRRIR